MSLVERISEEELMLYEILRNPVLFFEFVKNIDNINDEKNFELTDYQKEFMCDFNSYVSICCARSVGKSETLMGIILWLLINGAFSPPEYIVYTVPSKVHLEPVWSKLTRLLRSNSFLRHFVDNKTGINSASYTVTLLNKSQLICRIAGQTGDGTNVFGLHTVFCILDESGIYPWGTWLELQPIINTFEQGFRLIVSGVPTGLRDKNVCFYCDQENELFSKHRVPALRNPRFTETDRQKAIESYGSEDSDEYIHMILGEHGKPVYSVFDRATMKISNYPVYKLSIDGNKLGDDISLYIDRINLIPSISDTYEKVIFGIDLGYTEPTAIYILYGNDSGIFFFHARIRLDRVSYYIQEKIFDYLDTRFRPMVIGIDEGSAGKSVVHSMIDNDEYKGKDYRQRIFPVNFSSSIVTGVDSDGNEIRVKVKPLAVNTLQEYVNNHKLVFSSTDFDIISELERMTYRKNPNGDIIYTTLTERGGKRGEDHFTSALMCGILAYSQNFDIGTRSKNTKKLFNPVWII